MSFDIIILCFFKHLISNPHFKNMYNRSDFAILAVAVSKVQSGGIFEANGIVPQRQFSLLDFQMFLALLAN